MIDPASTIGTQLALAAPPPAAGGETKAAAADGPGDDLVSRLFGADGFNFLDILDIINPLQHIPFVSTLYRQLTGDTIAPAARVAGGTLFGGPIGAAVSLVNTVIAEFSGKDISDHVVAFFTGEDAAEDATQIAENSPQAAPAPQAPPEPVASAPAKPPPAGDARPSPLLAVAAGGGEPALPSPSGPPPGWYSDVMLRALTEYEQTARLSRPAPGTAIDAAY